MNGNKVVVQSCVVTHCLQICKWEAAESRKRTVMQCIFLLSQNEKKMKSLELEIIYNSRVIHSIFKYGNTVSLWCKWLRHVSTAQATYHTPTESPLQFWHKTQEIKTLSLKKIQNVDSYQWICRLSGSSLNHHNSLLPSTNSQLWSCRSLPATS